MVGNDPDCADPDCTISAEHVNSLDVNTALGRFYDDTIAAVIANPAVDASESVIRNWFENELITEGGTRGTVYKTKKRAKPARWTMPLSLHWPATICCVFRNGRGHLGRNCA